MFHVIAVPPTSVTFPRTVVIVTNNSEVREFLKSRRARITPEMAGLPIYGGLRRVPGLRREELAAVSGMSIDYYNRLERGNLTGVSDSILDSLARALKLDDAERTYLFDLARAANLAAPAAPARAAEAQPQHPAPARRHDRESRPSYRTDDSTSSAMNDLARALYHSEGDGQREPVNFARFVFLDDRSRDQVTEWEAMAQDIVAILRQEAARDPHNRDLSDLIGELSTKSENFRTMWAAQNVRFHHTGAKSFHHPVVGEFELTFQAMQLPGDEGLTLFAYTAEPGSRGRRRTQAPRQLERHRAREDPRRSTSRITTEDVAAPTVRKAWRSARPSKRFSMFRGSADQEFVGPFGGRLLVEAEVEGGEVVGREALFAATDVSGDRDTGDVHVGPVLLVVQCGRICPQSGLPDRHGCILGRGRQREPAAGEQQTPTASGQGWEHGFGSDLGTENIDGESVDPPVVVAVRRGVSAKQCSVVDQNIRGSEFVDGLRQCRPQADRVACVGDETAGIDILVAEFGGERVEFVRGAGEESDVVPGCGERSGKSEAEAWAGSDDDGGSLGHDDPFERARADTAIEWMEGGADRPPIRGGG